MKTLTQQLLKQNRAKLMMIALIKLSMSGITLLGVHNEYFRNVEVAF